MASSTAKTKKPRARRKRRTRQHVIESISFYWLGLLVSQSGHVFDSPSKDYGTDCLVTTHDPATGFPEANLYRVQLKATDSFVIEASGVVNFSVDTRDLRSWNEEMEPRFLVIFDAQKERAVWLHVQDYLNTHAIDPEALTGDSFRVHIPATDIVDAAAVRLWRERKNKRVEEIWSLLNA